MRGVELTGQPLSLSEIAEVAYGGGSIQLGASAYGGVEASRKWFPFRWTDRAALTVE